MWCSGYHYCTTLFNEAWNQVLQRFKSCLQHVGDSQWWESLTMVQLGNKAKCFSLVNQTTKTIHHSSSSSSDFKKLSTFQNTQNLQNNYSFLCQTYTNFWNLHQINFYHVFLSYVIRHLKLPNKLYWTKVDQKLNFCKSF